MPTLDTRLRAFVSKHKLQGILLDTNVLLLFLFATHMPTLIGTSRLAKYGERDGKLLVNYIRQFNQILTTPHVLAETSNLARQIVRGKWRSELSSNLYPLFCLTHPNSFEQCVVDGQNIDIDIDLFGKLGFTDSGLVTLAQTERLLLTDDLDLYIAATTSGGDAIQFTHMREAAGTTL
jgi:hypothetical protein